MTGKTRKRWKSDINEFHFFSFRCRSLCVIKYKGKSFKKKKKSKQKLNSELQRMWKQFSFVPQQGVRI